MLWNSKIARSLPVIIVILAMGWNLDAQVISPVSFHFEQNRYYSGFGKRSAAFYDSISGFTGPISSDITSGCQLKKNVFGFHPYWAGSDYLNYQWNLLSDLCYFSYEVDPSTGEPVTFHDWLSDPAIDSAQVHGVGVHLCATIFSGHSVFFHNLAARQNLITNLISLVQQRNADGINMDIEALPSSLDDSLTVFMRDLSARLKATLPAAKLSIDLPAVDWSGSFHIVPLSDYVDWFFIMGYDYYWNSSPEAGPVSPLYSLEPGYDFSLARTVSAYQAAGMDREKMILGVPYYGRQWKTQSNNIPSQIIANGVALTYANIRSNTGNYNPGNYLWEPNSFSSCYIFFQNDHWNQCFIGLDRDLRKKYDLVNYRGLAGIGIWALGYDNGFPELWQAISDKFTDCYIPAEFDTLYDSGGPAWDYYAGEYYIMTVDKGFNDTRYLDFTAYELEEEFDSLWLYAGPDTTYPLLGGFSGDDLPGRYSSPNGSFTFRFSSDPVGQAPGWMAVYHDGSMQTSDLLYRTQEFLTVYPNPAGELIHIEPPVNFGKGSLIIMDSNGKLMHKQQMNSSDGNVNINLAKDWPSGIYMITIQNLEGEIISRKFIRFALTQG